MRIEPATSKDVAYVAERMRPRDIDEFLPLSHFKTAPELITSLTARFGRHQEVFVVYDDKEPVAVGGMILHRPNVATLLFFATGNFRGAVAVDFTRFVKRRLFPMYVERGVHRIECQALAGYREVRRWLTTLGLPVEAVMKGFGRNGETYIQHAWVADASSPGA